MEVFNCNSLNGIMCTGGISNACEPNANKCHNHVWSNCVSELYLGDKSVTQSTTTSNGDPERAIDGDANSLWNGGSCTKTGLYSLTPLLFSGV